MRPRAPQVWGLLFQRLQSARTPKYVRGFLTFLAGFILRHGAAAATASIDAVQSGLFSSGVLAQARHWPSLLSRPRDETDALCGRPARAGSAVASVHAH
jgi:hypothetical protein